MKINVPELKKTGTELGGLLIGSIGGNTLFGMSKKLNTLPIAAGTCLAAGVGASLISNSFAKNVVLGVSVFAGLKACSLALNGTLNGLGEDTPEVGLKVIPENIKATLRKFIPNLGEGGSDYEMGATESAAIRVESPEIEGVQDEIEGIGRLFRGGQKSIQVYKNGYPVRHNGNPLQVSLLGDNDAIKSFI